MKVQNWRRIIWWLFGLALIASQCANPRSTTEPAAPETPILAPPTPALETPDVSGDLLDIVNERGYLKVGVKVWPDSAYNPPVFRNAFGALDGYEVDLAWAIANELNVGLEMAESDPQRIAAGNWGGEWDIAIAWLPITDNAQQTLIFSRPYANDAGSLIVHNDNQNISNINDLAGKRIGVPAGSIYHQILTGQTLSVNGEYLSGSIPADIRVAPFNRAGSAFNNLAEGDGAILDAVIHSTLLTNRALEGSLPLKQTAAELYPVSVGIAFDRSALPAERLRSAINVALTKMEQNGSLAELSIKWYEQDF